MADAAGGSQLFENYEQEYRAISLAIANKVNSVIPKQAGEPRKTTIRAAERELEEADEIIGQMELELQRLPQQTKVQLSSRLRSSKADLDKLKRDLKRAVARSGDRDELMGGRIHGLDADATQFDQRQRLISGTDRLNESTRRLEDSHRLALETEAVGVGILGDLRAQREQIQHTRDTLHEADSYVDKAQRTLRSMARR
ncbi:t-SNARE [Thamnocephalis sphaerospora]|uniref:t-SNARE n=1 Tax=Thamnocephalis sphaerospora TaxID=78915 RepID=A0A4P9XXF5_9FUNG|nr:t-SNARE [Thamnocephalis sphaerospora]|eukprot:RKP10997.1 t-SNARE [Thamnocephalis sphaerospora]